MSYVCVARLIGNQLKDDPYSNRVLTNLSFIVKYNFISKYMKKVNFV